MHTYPRPGFCSRAGFSLLEMAIVITIIGLIVGAVVGGREFMRNAELTTLMNESKFYINQFNQFQTNYSAVAGDMANASVVWPVTAHNGDGNGLVRAAAAANTVEVFYTFEHLSLAGLITGSYSGATTGGGGTYYATIGTNVPTSIVSGVTYLFDHPDALDGNVSADALYFDGLYPNVLRVAAVGANALPAMPILSPRDALQSDLKFDDGIPNTGWIVTPKSSALANCTTGAGPYAYDSTGTNANNKTCYFILRMQQ